MFIYLIFAIKVIKKYSSIWTWLIQSWFDNQAAGKRCGKPIRYRWPLGGEKGQAGYILCTWYSAHREAPWRRRRAIIRSLTTPKPLTRSHPRRNRRAFLFPRKFVPARDIIRLCWRTAPRRRNAAFLLILPFGCIDVYMYYAKYGVKWRWKITERLTMADL